MTLAELTDWIEEELQAPASQDIVRRLNLANDEVSRELRVPTKLLKDQDATVTFNLPTNARTNGLLEVWEQTNDSRVQIYSVPEVAEVFPRWVQSDFKDKLIIYDPYNTSAPVTPKGFDAGEKLRYRVILKPADMVNPTDEPFDGEAPEFHTLVAKRVVMKLLARKPDDISIRHYSIIKAEFESEMRTAFGVARHPVYKPLGPRKIVFPR